MMTAQVAPNSKAPARLAGVTANWLGLAASPASALMALIVAGAPQMPMCASPSGGLPFGSMAWMYLLMSLFHLSPWLKLASRAGSRSTHSPL
jgi:hypothetical protein